VAINHELIEVIVHLYMVLFFYLGSSEVENSLEMSLCGFKFFTEVMAKYRGAFKKLSVVQISSILRLLVLEVVKAARDILCGNDSA